MFGSHLSIAGTMVNALAEAEALGLDTVQVFTKNQKQWKAKPLDDAVVKDWRTGIARLNWQGRTVSHASYLINLATHNDELWTKSLDLMTDEIERCEMLGIPYLVHHPGSFVGWTLEQGISRIGEAYKELFRRTAGYKTVSCLEGTAGAGSHIGGPFEHLAALRTTILDRTGQPERLGYCLDTCHMHAAGYDLSTRDSAASVLEEFDRLCGISNIRVMHLNDSKGKVGSHLDRHEHIGQGWIGGGATLHNGVGKFNGARLAKSGFYTVVNNPHLGGVPKILETPKGKTDGDVPWDRVNLKRLKALLA